jgi:hypothetical protein
MGDQMKFNGWLGCELAHLQPYDWLASLESVIQDANNIF